jgi:hypothetical protein
VLNTLALRMVDFYAVSYCFTELKRGSRGPGGLHVDGCNDFVAVEELLVSIGRKDFWLFYVLG